MYPYQKNILNYYINTRNYKMKEDVFLEVLGMDKYLFKMPFGNNIKPDWLTRNWTSFLEKNNLRHIRLHGLRHTCATYLLSIGTPIATVSRKLGHSDIYTTLNTYTHSIDKDDLDAVEKLA